MGWEELGHERTETFCRIPRGKKDRPVPWTAQMFSLTKSLPLPLQHFPILAPWLASLSHLVFLSYWRKPYSILSIGLQKATISQLKMALDCTPIWPSRRRKTNFTYRREIFRIVNLINSSASKNKRTTIYWVFAMCQATSQPFYISKFTITLWHRQHYFLASQMRKQRPK